jgi:SAM-dependent methyltransferase
MQVDWQERYVHQACWTKNIRDYLLQQASLSHNARILELGSGTGAVLSDIASQFPLIAFGIDVKLDHSVIATRNYKNFSIATADSCALPFTASSFDMVFCHYFFLWLVKPRLALDEAFRVLKPGGYFFAFAEPDYLERIDFPPQLARLGKLQTLSLRDQGADPGMGKKLVQLLLGSGFQVHQFGVSGYEQPAPGLPLWWESEWDIFEHDLAGLLSLKELKRLQVLDHSSWIKGERILYVPTYYASAVKP